MDDKWGSSDLIAEYAAELLALSEVGLGRRKIAKRMQELTGRSCSGTVVETALKRMKGERPEPRGLPRPKPIPIADTGEGPEEQPIGELLDARVTASRRKKSKSTMHRRALELPAEPLGIICYGDPHLDDEGCDWATLIEYVRLAQTTPGVLAASVGDQLNNWVGRLQREYADSSCLASDGWRLNKWLLESMQWIAITGGNHDAWANGPGMDPLQWLSKDCRVMCYAPDEIRITLTWAGRPELEPIVWILRHDFKGRSVWNTCHGPNKEAMLDGRAHILTCGHIHNWGEFTTEQRHGRVTHAIRVRGFKRQDNYALTRGFPEQEFGSAAMILIDPCADGPGRVKVFWDVAQGCDYLTFLRARAEK